METNALTGCTLRVVEMDFSTKAERSIPPEEIAAARERGRFVWIDAEVLVDDAARQALNDLALCPPDVVEHALTGAAATQLARYESCLHLTVTGCRAAGSTLELSRVDTIIAENIFVTIHRDQPDFLAAMRRAYRSDFVHHAKSPSFLLYELWDHLLESYHTVQKNFEDQVEEVQRELVRATHDDVFQRVSDIGAALLHFRKVLLPARAVLSELASRRSVFVSEATQPYLANMVGTVERVLQDLLVDRDILSESLNLYMSIVGYRTNKVMNRLTVVSVIFLPLSFLCGIYGMNFEVLPELKWSYGYLLFWVVVVSLVSTSLYLLRKHKVI